MSLIQGTSHVFTDNLINNTISIKPLHQDKKIRLTTRKELTTNVNLYNANVTGGVVVEGDLEVNSEAAVNVGANPWSWTVVGNVNTLDADGLDAKPTNNVELSSATGITLEAPIIKLQNTTLGHVERHTAFSDVVAGPASNPTVVELVYSELPSILAHVVKPDLFTYNSTHKILVASASATGWYLVSLMGRVNYRIPASPTYYYPMVFQFYTVDADGTNETLEANSAFRFTQTIDRVGSCALIWVQGGKAVKLKLWEGSTYTSSGTTDLTVNFYKLPVIT